MISGGRKRPFPTCQVVQRAWVSGVRPYSYNANQGLKFNRQTGCVGPPRLPMATGPAGNTPLSLVNCHLSTGLAKNSGQVTVDSYALRVARVKGFAVSTLDSHL